MILPARDPSDLAVFDPRTTNVREVSLGPTGLLEPSPGSVLFLGHVYPYALLRDWSQVGSVHGLLPTDRLCHGLQYPDPGRLAGLLALGEVAMRPLYLYMHQVLEDLRDSGTLSSALVTALVAEYIQYRRIDLMWLRRRVYSRLDNEKPTGHMRFQGHLALSKRRPDVRWHGHVDVPVHRLLWPYVNRLQALRPEDRLRKRDICPDELYRDCVNPAHFEIAIPMSDRRMLAPGQQNTQRSRYTSFLVTWTDTDDFVWPEHEPITGRILPMVHCSRRHVMPAGVQDHYWMWSDPQHPRYRALPYTCTSKCNECYAQHWNERGRNPDGSPKRHPRGRKVHNAQAEDQAERDALRGAWLMDQAEGRVEYPIDNGVDDVAAFIDADWPDA